MINSWFFDSSQDRAFEELYCFGDIIGKGGAPWIVHKCISKFSSQTWTVKTYPKKDETKHKKANVGPLIALTHPNLIRIKEVFETATEVQVVMQFYEGGDLFDKLANRETFSEHVVANCVKQIIEAIKYLHMHGITHGNLKPENVILKGVETEDLIVLIGDYGIDRLLGQHTVQTVNVCTATDFCAPETLKGKKFDNPIDLWAVGVLTYILLCGYEPFRSDIEAEKFKLILKCDFAFDPFDWADVTDIAKDFVHQLITLNPKSRPTAAQALHHCWLNGAAPKARQLEAAPNRLKQFTNKRFLKLSTEVAKPFTAETLSDTFPRHFSTLEHLLEPLSTTMSTSSSKVNMAELSTHDAPHPASSITRAIMADRDPNDQSANWALEDSAEGYERGQQLAAVDLPSIDMSAVCTKGADDQFLASTGLVFGEPLPYNVPSTGFVVLSAEEVDQVVTSEIFPQKLLFDSEFAAVEPAYNIDMSIVTDADKLPPDMPSDLPLDMPPDVIN